MVSKGPSHEVKCPLESRVDMNQKDSGERIVWKERKPSTESLRRKIRVSKLADSENKKGTSVVGEQQVG